MSSSYKPVADKNRFLLTQGDCVYRGLRSQSSLSTDKTLTTVAHPHLGLGSASMSFHFRGRLAHGLLVCPVNGHCACHWVTQSIMCLCLCVCSNMRRPCKTPVSVMETTLYFGYIIRGGGKNFSFNGYTGLLDLCIQECSGVHCAGVCCFNWLPLQCPLEQIKRK